MWLIALGIFLFLLLIVAHEYGHFLVAKRNGVDVEEFGIGFPPKIYGKELGRGIFRSYYTINLLPLGGFVRLKGESGGDTEKGSLNSASTRSKLKIMMAGVLVNLVAGLLIFTVVAWVGMPQVVPDQFTVTSDSKTVSQEVYAAVVGKDSPAYKSGLRDGDTILSINGEPVVDAVDLPKITSANAGKTVPLVFRHQDTEVVTTTTLLNSEEAESKDENGNNKGYFGVVPMGYTLIRSTWSAPIVAVGVSAQFTGLTLKAIGGSLLDLGQSFVNLITGNLANAKTEISNAGENVSGPVGIFAVLQQGSNLGIEFILFVVAILSLTLAIMNALPIPALDGGRAFLMLLFKALRRPLRPELEDKIHLIGFATLLLLFFVITVVDIRRFY